MPIESAYWFRAGTVSVDAGSSIVTGLNTYWLNAVMRPAAGDAFSLDGQRWYEIALIEADGKLKVHGTFTAAAQNVGYMIKPVVSASPVLRLQAQIADILGQNRTFFLQLNKFWYEPGEVTVTDPFGVTHKHKTLYTLKQDIDAHALQLATMIESAAGAVEMFNSLQQNVNTLSSTVNSLQATVDSKLTAAAASASEAKLYRDETLVARNTAVSKADEAAAAVVVATQKATDATSASVVATTKAGEAAGSATQAANSATAAADANADVQARQLDVANKHDAVSTKHADVVVLQADVISRHNDITTKTDVVSAKHADVISKHAEVVSGAQQVAADVGTSAANAALAASWASGNEDVVVSAGLFSARHYSLKAQQFAQQTAANVSGGTSFRGWHNPTGGVFPAGAQEGYMYKLSAGATLTFETDGAVAASAGDYIIKTASGWIHLDDARDSVKTSRTVNGQALSSDINLTATDVGARANTWNPTFADIGSKPTSLAGYGIADAVALQGDQTINGNKTFTGSITAQSYVANNALVARGFAGEGGQLVLGYAGAVDLVGQGNSSWNIDVDSTNQLRFFRVDGVGASLVAAAIAADTGLFTISYRLKLSSLSATEAPLNIASRGTADPSTLGNGDIWHRSDALYARLGGITRTLIHTGNPTALATDVSQSEAEAGTNTSRRWFTPQRVAQAIAAQAAPKTATQTKLDELQAKLNEVEALAILGL